MSQFGTRQRYRRGEQGFAYIALMIAVLAMGVVLAAIGEVWWTAQKRSNEQQLLFIGAEFRRAIASYSAQDSAMRYPLRLEDLLRDPRYPGVKRHLRKIYADPVSGATRWGLVKGRSGEIYGVYSLSDDAPLKRAEFAAEDAQFEGKTRYSEWVFSPVSAGPSGAASNPGATTAGPAPKLR